MEIYFKAFLILILSGSSGYAQSLSPIDAAGEHLGQSLSDLKTSVTRLSAGNQTLANTNARLKTRLEALRLRLRDLGVQEDQMSKEAAKLKMVDGPRAKRIAQLEKELFGLNEKLEHIATDSQDVRESMARSMKQDEELAGRLDQMGVHVEVKTLAVPNADRLRQKERLKILKMIYDSKQAKQKLEQRIFDVRKALPAAALAQDRKEQLSKEISMARQEVLRLNVSANGPGKLDEHELRQLEAQVGQLQKNYDQWQGLAQKMQQRAQKAPLSPQERSERNKLRSSLDGLLQEGNVLKADLRGLRQQMVELDKRKSYLEVLLVPAVTR